MALPLFYQDTRLENSAELLLDEETGRHVVQVLRMQHGEQLRLTDGKGRSALTTISRAEKKKCFVTVSNVQHHERRKTGLHMCVAFTKNASRNEWLLEKVTEMGVETIIPVMATRTERERIRYDRWQNIIVAALIQSQQYYLPELAQALSIKEILQRFNGTEQKLVGHCMEGVERTLLAKGMEKEKETVILIGPEGDFTQEEVLLCNEHGFHGISLGINRLRTETAAMASCAYFNMINYAS